MTAVIVAIGLEEELLSPETQFVDGPQTVGRAEIDRLLGSSRRFGDGPLPTFLRAATEATDTALVLVRAAGEDGSPAGDLMPLFAPLANHACVVHASDPLLPLEALRAAIADVAGGAVPRVLVVGAHSEAHVLPLAVGLRRFLDVPHVAATPHLCGSATREAHEACFRHNLPQSGVDVILDVAEAAAYAGLPTEAVAGIDAGPCRLGPEEATAALSADQARILQLLCMHWDRAELRALQGGYSGSLLLLARGVRAGSQTEPVVIKVDGAWQMRREIGGYHQVKDLFGKHVPAFGYPVSVGDLTGVAMELAAMEGSPETLQDTFEQAASEAELSRFLDRLDKSLALLGAKLYGNTSLCTAVAPYRQFQLHDPRQIEWLEQNAEFVLGYHDEDVGGARPVDPDDIATMLRIIATNDASIQSEICIAHGDLNFQNVICDSASNVWFIDWTHSGRHPLEMDFTKMENDVKFVMTKEFEPEDLPRLKQFEEYLVSERVPAPPEELPARLQYARWDLRFRRMLESVRRIRRACFDLKETDDWLVYRVGLLRYALHTLSFDARRERGECELVQLMHALHACEALVYDLIGDDFHLRIRSERPPSYPERLQVSIDEAPWSVDSPAYAPPYHVDAMVLEADWADPEDVTAIVDVLEGRGARHDDSGRPLNPRGRTGMAGRGLLGRWGPNAAVAAVLTRLNGDTGEIDILLGRKPDQLSYSIPTGFRRPDEDASSAILRVLEEETGWRPASAEGDMLHEGYSYDPRQTDHAWVELEARHLHVPDNDVPGVFRPGEEFEELAWRPLDEAVMADLVPAHEALVRAAAEGLAAGTPTPAGGGS